MNDKNFINANSCILEKLKVAKQLKNPVRVENDTRDKHLLMREDI